MWKRRNGFFIHVYLQKNAYSYPCFSMYIPQKICLSSLSVLSRCSFRFQSCIFTLRTESWNILLNWRKSKRGVQMWALESQGPGTAMCHNMKSIWSVSLVHSGTRTISPSSKKIQIFILGYNHICAISCNFSTPSVIAQREVQTAVIVVTVICWMAFWVRMIHIKWQITFKGALTYFRKSRLNSLDHVFLPFLNYRLSICEQSNAIPYYYSILLRKSGMCPSENHYKRSGKDDWLYPNSLTSNLSSPDTS